MLHDAPTQKLVALGLSSSVFRGGGLLAQGLVRVGVVSATPRYLGRVRREMSHWLKLKCLIYMGICSCAMSHTTTRFKGTSEFICVLVLGASSDKSIGLHTREIKAHGKICSDSKCISTGGR